MKKLFNITIILFICLFSINIYAENYEYYFENISGKNAKSDNSHGNTSLIKMEVWINDTNTITAKIEKKDKTYFDGGDLYLQFNTSDHNEIKRIECIENSYIGNDYSKTLTSSQNLHEIPTLWPDNKISIYARYENNDEYAWTGPVTIIRKASQISGEIYVKLYSQAAVDNGAAWSYEVDKDNWSPWFKSCDEPIKGLNIGLRKIRFKDVVGWVTPETKAVEIRNNQITNIEGLYIKESQSILVNVIPDPAIEAGAAWFTDFGSFGESTDYRPNYPVENFDIGEHTIYFRGIDGWQTPASQTINVTASQPVIITGIYCKDKPYAPRNLEASQGKIVNAVRLTWDPVSCINRYEIYRSLIDIPTANDRIENNVNSNYYIDTGVIPGQEYYYWVRAVNDKYLGDFSQYVRGFSKLDKPKNVKASDGSYIGKVRIEWDPVPGAMSYNIYRNTDENVKSARTPIASDIENNVFFDNNTTPELKYYYWVTAESALKESEKSAYDTGFSKLGVPQFINASDSEYSDYVKICFEPVEGVKIYELDRYSSTKKKKNNYKIINSETCLKDENAIPGNIYYYKVRATYGNVKGDWSKTDKGTRAMQKPELYATKRTSKEYIYLKWTLIESATRYYVYKNTVDDFSTAIQIASPVLYYYDYSTKDTQKLYFWVEAVNQYTRSISNSEIGYISDSCEFSISPKDLVVDAYTGLGEINVIVKSQNNCRWDAVSETDWIEIISNASGYEDGIVKFKALENRTIDNRNGIITIAGESIMVEQEGVNPTTLTIHKIGNGTVKINNVTCDLPLTKKVAKGDKISIEAIPDENWMFSNFSKGIITTENPKEIIIDGDTEIFANFTQDEYCLNVEVIGDGQVFINGEETLQKCFPKGMSVSLMAVNKPDTAYFFTNWSGDIESKNSLISVIIDDHKDIKAMFSGWAADFIAEGVNLGGYYKTNVSIGVSSKQFQTQSPPSPPRYSSLMKIRYNDKEVNTDIRLEGKEIYQWKLVVDPHGNMGDPQQEQSTVISWDPDSFSLTGTYQLFNGAETIAKLDDLNNKTILIKNMREINEYTVTGLSENNYFSVVWVPPFDDCPDSSCNSSPLAITLLCESEDFGGGYKYNSKIGIDRFSQTKPFPPASPVYSALMYLINDNKPLTVDIRKNDQNKYEWLLMVQPVGNAQPLGAENTVNLSWDISDQEYQGTFKLIKQTRQFTDDKVVIEDMSVQSEYSITGDDTKQYFKIVLQNGDNPPCEYNFELEAGWNLISLPIIPDKNKVKDIIPDAEIVYEFNGAQYVEVSNDGVMSPGKGYWVLVPSAASYYITGECFQNYNKNLTKGWHLMGCTNEISAPETTIIDSLEIMYEYIDGSYEIVTECTPGYGFWINLLEDSEFILNSQIK